VGRLNHYGYAKGALVISYLLFADGVIFFSEPNVHACFELKRILEGFYTSLGQLVNHIQSTIMTLKNLIKG